VCLARNISFFVVADPSLFAAVVSVFQGAV